MNEERIVAARLKLLAEYITDLQDLRDVNLDEYQANRLIRRAVERTLHTAIEACLDIGHHIIAVEKYRSPTNNSDVFVILGEQNILPVDLVPRLVEMAKFRNLLVHDYARLDDRVVHSILRRRLGDFDEFARAVVAYLEKQGR